MKQQTAVEWLVEQLLIYGDKAFNKEISLGEYHIKKDELIKQAKQMEKEQIILAATEMKRELIGNTMFNKEMKFQNGEEYYNKTYNK